MLHPDRLFPADPASRDLARKLFAEVEKLPIVSPHGHTDPRWWGENPHFSNPADLFVVPDHYVLRMLISQGVSYEALGIGEVFFVAGVEGLQVARAGEMEGFDRQGGNREGGAIRRRGRFR